jgi:hypothetical protein
MGTKSRRFYQPARVRRGSSLIKNELPKDLGLGFHPSIGFIPTGRLIVDKPKASIPNAATNAEKMQPHLQPEDFVALDALANLVGQNKRTPTA